MFAAIICIPTGIAFSFARDPTPLTTGYSRVIGTAIVLLMSGTYSASWWRASVTDQFCVWCRDPAEVSRTVFRPIVGIPTLFRYSSTGNVAPLGVSHCAVKYSPANGSRAHSIGGYDLGRIYYLMWLINVFIEELWRQHMGGGREEDQIKSI